MTPARSTSARRRSDRGAITWVTLVLVAALASGAYLAYVWVPVYWLHYAVKQVVRDYANQAVKDPNDAQLVEKMCHKLRVLDETVGVGEDGRPVRIPSVLVAPREVTWERTADPPTLHVAFEYSRVVELPLLERTAEKVFEVDMVLDISRPDWGPTR